jgi:hypothetical protein
MEFKMIGQILLVFIFSIIVGKKISLVYVIENSLILAQNLQTVTQTLVVQDLAIWYKDGGQKVKTSCRFCTTRRDRFENYFTKTKK